MPGHRDPLLIVGQVMVVVLFVSAAVILPLYFRHRLRTDHHDIRDEAERRGCRVRSIRYDWFGGFRGPLAGELRARRSRTYRVECEEDGRSRLAGVLIGPRRNYESTEQLTWRWYDEVEF